MRVAPEQGMNSRPFPADARLARLDQVVVRDIAGETLLIPIRSNVAQLDSVFVLNETGKFIWEHLDGTQSLHGIVTLVCDTFEVENTEAEADVDEFVGLLASAGLVTATA
jgi:hypothetical protein